MLMYLNWLGLPTGRSGILIGHWRLRVAPGRKGRCFRNRKAYQLPVHSLREIFPRECFTPHPEEIDYAGTPGSQPERRSETVCRTHGLLLDGQYRSVRAVRWPDLQAVNNGCRETEKSAVRPLR